MFNLKPYNSNNSKLNITHDTIMKPMLKIITGFLLLFVCYHLAEYFILFQNNVYLFFLFQLIFFTVAWLIARWQGFSGLAAWGLDSGKRWAEHILAGIAAGAVLYSVTFAVSLLAGSEKIISLPEGKTAYFQFAVFGFGVFFSSLSEDILTRGYLFKHLGSNIPGGLFVFLSATVYLLNHIYRLTDGWETCSYLFVLGILFAIPLVMTRRLWFTGGMHWMGNTVFYFTHNTIQPETVAGRISPNILFIFCILLFIPLVILAIKKLHWTKTVNHQITISER